MRVSALLLVRRARPLGEPREVEEALADGRRLIEAPLTGSRIADLLRALVPDLANKATENATQWLPDLDAKPAALARSDLGGPFETVVLASHLVNSPAARLRRAILGVAARHVAPAGRVLIEHHPLDWLATAAESWSQRDGQRLGTVDVRVEPPFVSAVSVFDVGGKVVRQPFTARVLSEDEISVALVDAGLSIRRRLSPTWLEAVPAGGAAAALE